MKIPMTLLAVCAVSGLAAVGGPLAYEVGFSASAPVVDGALADACWENAAWSSPFVLRKTGGEPSRATRFKARAAKDALYLAVECMEPTPAKIADEHQAHEFWLCDVVEFYASPVKNEQLHLILSARGNRNEELSGVTRTRTRDYTDWQGASQIAADRWTCEFRIPWVLLGVSPAAGDVSFAFNFCRNATPSKELSSWSFQSGSFKDESGFGRLTLKAAPSTVAAEMKRLADVSLLPETPAEKAKRERAEKVSKGVGDAVVWWGTVDPMSPKGRLPDMPVEPDELFQPVRVQLAKGEYKPASFVVRARKDLPDFTAVVSGLDGIETDVRVVKVAAMCGGAGGGGTFLRLKKPAYLLHDDDLLKVDLEKMENFLRLSRTNGVEYVRTSDAIGGRRFEQFMSAAEWPVYDAKALCPIDLPADFSKQYWLTFHAAENARPGVRKGKVFLVSEGKTLAEIPVELTVLPFALPEPRTRYDLTRKFYPGVYYRHYDYKLGDPSWPGSVTARNRSESQFRAELKSLRAHGILYPTLCMSFAFPGWRWNEFDNPVKGGRRIVPSEAQRDYFKRCIAIMKEEGFPMDKLMLHTGGNFGFRCGFRKSEHLEDLKWAIAETMKLVREAVGYETTVEFYGVDEAFGERLTAEYEVWEEMRKLGARVYTTTTGARTPLVVGRIDTQIASYKPDIAFAKMQHEAGGTIWSYANPQAGFKDDAATYRVNYGFGLYAVDYDGFATYAWNVSAESPWNDFDNIVEADHAFVVPTADGIVETPSYEGYREAVDDIRYATLLAQLCRDNPGATADEAKAFLLSIDPAKRGFDATWTRGEIVSRILKLLAEQVEGGRLKEEQRNASNSAVQPPTSNLQPVLQLANLSTPIPAFVRERAGRDWRDGLLVANGATAALAYAPAHFEWTINRNDLYDGTVADCDYMPHAEVKKLLEGMSPRHTMPIKDRVRGDSSLRSTISAATLRISPWTAVGWAIPTPPAVSESLDMERGLLTAKMTAPWFSGSVQSCVPRAHDVLALRIVDDDQPGRRYKIDLSPIDDYRLGAPKMFSVDGVSGFTRRMPDGRFYAAARSDGASREIFVAVRVAKTEAEAEHQAREAVVGAAKAGFAALEAENAAWWADFWKRGARVSLPQYPAIERQWYYSLYALASQYGTAPMPGLNGLVYGPWDASTPGIGSQGYTHDQNVQIPMFAFFPLNHAEFVVPFADTYLSAMPLLKEQTRARFGTDGVCLPLNMNQDGRELPVGAYRYTLCGSAYSGLVLCWAWRYSHDVTLLKEKIYPLLKEFATFYLALSEKGADGRYHFDRMVPPEIFSVTIDESSAVSMLHTCLMTLVEASELLNADADLRSKWRDVLAHYPTIAKHSSGAWWCGPEIPDDASMWGGHLFYPFFPAEYDTDDLVAARKTLEYAQQEAKEMIYGWGKPHPSTDWSMFYQTATAVRLGDRKLGWTMVNDFYDWFRKPNGLFSHNPVIVDPAVAGVTVADLEARVRKLPAWNKCSWDGRLTGNQLRTGGAEISSDPDAKRLVPPVIEGGSAFLFLASETLCQSWGGKIRLFPCVPENFTGSFENFRVQGGKTVSAKMVNGKLVSKMVE